MDFDKTEFFIPKGCLSCYFGDQEWVDKIKAEAEEIKTTAENICAEIYWRNSAYFYMAAAHHDGLPTAAKEFFINFASACAAMATMEKTS